MNGRCLFEFVPKHAGQILQDFYVVYPDFLGLVGNVADLLYLFNIQVKFDLHQAASYPCA